jgi:hypothetical protein
MNDATHAFSSSILPTEPFKMNRSILNYKEDILVNDDYHEKYFRSMNRTQEEKKFRFFFLY